MKKALPYIIIIVAGIAALLLQGKMNEHRYQKSFDKEMVKVLDEAPYLIEERLEGDSDIADADVDIDINQTEDAYEEILHVTCTLKNGFSSDMVSARASALHSIMVSANSSRYQTYEKWSHFGDVALGYKNNKIDKDYYSTIWITILNDGFSYDYFDFNGMEETSFYVSSSDPAFTPVEVPFSSNYQSLLVCDVCGNTINYVELGCTSHTEEPERIIEEEPEPEEIIEEELEEDTPEGEIVEEESKEEIPETEDVAEVEDPVEEPVEDSVVQEPAKQPVEEPEEEIVIDATGVTPEVKEALDSIEGLFDEYIDFMKSFSFSSSSSDSFAKYSEIMIKYMQAMAKLDKMGEMEMTDRDFEYYLAVVGKINKKLLKFGK